MWPNWPKLQLRTRTLTQEPYLLIFRRWLNGHDNHAFNFSTSTTTIGEIKKISLHYHMVQPPLHGLDIVDPATNTIQSIRQSYCPSLKNEL